MELAVSGKFSNDVFDNAFDTTKVFKAILAGGKFDDIATSLKSLLYFPVVVSESLRIEKKSSRSYSKKENAEFVNVELPFQEWIVTDLDGQIRLLMDGLRVAVRETDENKIGLLQKEAILDELQLLQKEFQQSARNARLDES